MPTVRAGVSRGRGEARCRPRAQPSTGDGDRRRGSRLEALRGARGRPAVAPAPCVRAGPRPRTQRRRLRPGPPPPGCWSCARGHRLVRGDVAVLAILVLFGAYLGIEAFFRRDIRTLVLRFSMALALITFVILGVTFLRELLLAGLLALGLLLIVDNLGELRRRGS